MMLTLLRQQRHERVLYYSCAGMRFDLRWDPVASTRPSLIATSQSNRSASSM
jgi:hypothetical protein